MATIDRFATDTIRKSNPHLSQLKATIEPAFIRTMRLKFRLWQRRMN